MAWRRPGDKPLSEPMLISLPTYICVTRHQWVKEWNPLPWHHNERDGVSITGARFFAEPFVQAKTKENIKAPRHSPLWGEFTGDPWYFTHTNGQYRGKFFHLMILSWLFKKNNDLYFMFSNYIFLYAIQIDEYLQLNIYRSILNLKHVNVNAWIVEIIIMPSLCTYGISQHTQEFILLYSNRIM